MGEKPDALGSGLSEGGMSGGPVYKNKTLPGHAGKGFAYAQSGMRLSF